MRRQWNFFVLDLPFRFLEFCYFFPWSQSFRQKVLIQTVPFFSQWTLKKNLLVLFNLLEKIYTYVTMESMQNFVNSSNITFVT